MPSRPPRHPEYLAAIEAALVPLASRSSFTAEDLRKLVGDPPDPNSFGSYFKVLSSRRLIKHVGYTPTSRTKARGHIVSRWAVVQGGLH